MDPKGYAFGGVEGRSLRLASFTRLPCDAVDQVHRAEQRRQSVLRGTRYIWLRDPANLSERQRATLDSLPTRHLKTARTCQSRLVFQNL